MPKGAAPASAHAQQKLAGCSCLKKASSAHMYSTTRRQDVRTIQSSCSASTSLCLGEDVFMESSHDPIAAAPRSTCAAAIFRHDSPPPLVVLGGGNEKCRAAATTASASAGTSFFMAIEWLLLNRAETGEGAPDLTVQEGKGRE
jgi:hypothetical protein